jgi:hypothetical protein
MIDSPVVVLGPLRSGCSLIAGVCHRLGWSAGMSLFPPQPPTWRLDWQDQELSMLLVEGRRPTREWFVEYLERRRRYAEEVGMGGRYVLNCQWLVFVWDELLAALAPVKPFILRTYRAPETVAASMAAHPALKQKDQEAIQALLYKRIAPDAEIGYEYATDDPGRFVRGLAKHLDVDDDEAVQAAIGLVGKPTSYACSPQKQTSP